jgi:hypothetical protein
MSAANSFATAIQPSEEAFGINRRLNLPAAGTGPGVFENYGYEPTSRVSYTNPKSVKATKGGIVDPTYLAQLALLNQPQVKSVKFNPLGSGLISVIGSTGIQGNAPTIADYRDKIAEMNARNAVGFSDPGYVAYGFGNGGGDSFGGFGDSGFGGGFDGTSSGPFGGISEGFDGSPSAPSANDGAQEGFDGSPGDGGGGGGGGKIICTAMNHAYGFGSFRQGIWLRYSAQHMTKAHEVGYHTLFLPLVHAAYHQDKWYSKTIRKVLEHGTRHRTADLRAEMRGTKRDTLGRFYRSIFEPLCYAVGKLKGY